jgi:hypothetical protein
MPLRALLLALQAVVPSTEDYALPDEPAAREQAEAHFGRMERLLPLAAEMGRIHALDQYSRRSLTSAFGDLDTRAAFAAYTESVAAHLDEVDALVTTEFRALLEQSSWAEFAEAPQFLLGPALSIVKHTADEELQQQALEDLKALVRRGTVPSEDVASLTDMIEVKAGRMQVFGTRLKCVDGKRTAFDLLDPDHVDERRAEVGLEPLAAYIRAVDAKAPPCPSR